MASAGTFSAVTSLAAFTTVASLATFTAAASSTDVVTYVASSAAFTTTTSSTAFFTTSTYLAAAASTAFLAAMAATSAMASLTVVADPLPLDPLGIIDATFGIGCGVEACFGACCPDSVSPSTVDPSLRTSLILLTIGAMCSDDVSVSLDAI
jgi:hypothetical protein